MRLLLNSTAEIQKYIKIDSTTEGLTFLPYVGDAQEKYIRPVLSKEMLDELLDYSLSPDKTDEDDEKYGELLDKTCNALAKFTFFLAAPNFDVKLTGSGFAVVMNANMAPASDKRVQALRDALETQGWDCVETLIRYLEANKEIFTAWTGSDAYTLQIRNFINSAEEFDVFVNINNSRLRFKNLRQVMDNVEMLKIQPVISGELSEEIISQIKTGSLSDANKKICDMIKRAVANYTVAYENDDVNRKYEGLGDNFIGIVKRKIDATPDDYPAYKGSSCYVVPVSYTRFDNDETSGVVMFGTN